MNVLEEIIKFGDPGKNFYKNLNEFISEIEIINLNLSFNYRVTHGWWRRCMSTCFLKNEMKIEMEGLYLHSS